MLQKIQENKIYTSFRAWLIRSHARSRMSSSGHNAVNGVITTDRRSGVAAPTIV